jgi:hypothetical protein
VENEQTTIELKPDDPLPLPLAAGLASVVGVPFDRIFETRPNAPGVAFLRRASYAELVGDGE